MSGSRFSTAVPRTLMFTISLLLVSGVIVVPWLMTFSSFAVFAAVAVVGSWVCMATLRNAQPVSSLAQAIHDSEAAPRKRTDRL
jgi:hypothetical protein